VQSEETVLAGLAQSLMDDRVVDDVSEPGRGERVPAVLSQEGDELGDAPARGVDIRRVRSR